MALKSRRTVRARAGIRQLETIANRAQHMLAKLCDDPLEWNLRKVAPSFTSNQVAKLCHIDRAALNYLCTRGRKDGYSVGTLNKDSYNRTFTLAETQEFVRANGCFQPRPQGLKGIICTVANFKAGVGKTTCAVGLAQGLTLRGYKVLLIDVDPQAGSTMLLGYIPDIEIDEDMTIMPVINGKQQDLQYTPIQTYWNELDLIPSCHALFDADLFLVTNQEGNASFNFWTVLDTALERLRYHYDVIVIDTPPNLSYLTTAAFMAADGLIIPMPADALDFISSTQFFRKLAELVKQHNKNRDVEKNFEFIKVVISKLNSLDTTTAIMKEWVRQTYHELVTTAEIIQTDIVKDAGTTFQTLYEIKQYDGSQKNFTRALEALDSFIGEIDAAVQNAWQVRIAAGIAYDRSGV